MKGLFVKKFATVVMDGSDENVLNTIKESINIVTGERYGTAECHDLNGDRPMVKVIEVRTERKTYDKIRGMIERAYPGLCVFSAMM